ncbi:MAG: hypothetical protein IPN76_26255 [Saprospiraceae bacterium]|nr:hypothetical protein [Saprospiraceae bacterium]
MTPIFASILWLQRCKNEFSGMKSGKWNAILKPNVVVFNSWKMPRIYTFVNS